MHVSSYREVIVISHQESRLTGKQRCHSACAPSAIARTQAQLLPFRHIISVLMVSCLAAVRIRLRHCDHDPGGLEFLQFFAWHPHKNILIVSSIHQRLVETCCVHNSVIHLDGSAMGGWTALEHINRWAA